MHTHVRIWKYNTLTYSSYNSMHTENTLHVCMIASVQLAVIMSRQRLPELKQLCAKLAPAEEINALRAQLQSDADLSLSIDAARTPAPIDLSALVPSQREGVQRLYAAAQREFAARALHMVQTFRVMSNEQLAEVGFELC